jgi:hypothetical protein
MLLFYQSSFNGVRIMLAISIFIYNLTNIENKKLYRFLLLTIVASTFHISVLITLPLYWLFDFLKFNVNLKKTFVVCICVVFVLSFINELFGYLIEILGFEQLIYYSKYIGSSEKSIDITIKKMILFIPILLPGVIFYKKFVKQNCFFSVYYCLVVIGVIIEVFSTFQADFFSRIAIYFEIFIVMIVPIYIKVLNEKRQFLTVFCIVSYLFLFWIYIYIVNNDHGTFPYQWVL